MKEGVSQSLEDAGRHGREGPGGGAAAGYGPTVRADAVKRLVDAVVDYQVRSREIIEEMRTLSTVNAEEIRDAVEDGKRAWRSSRSARRVEARAVTTTAFEPSRRRPRSTT
jgi:hypothetical protein